MRGDIETVYEDRRGRMRMKIVRNHGQYGPYYATLITRPFKRESEAGDSAWEETHWLDEQDILHSLRLHEIADDVIAEAKRNDSFRPGDGLE